MRRKYFKEEAPKEVEKGCVWNGTMCGVIDTGEVFDIVPRKGELKTILNTEYKVENNKIVRKNE